MKEEPSKKENEWLVAYRGYFESLSMADIQNAISLHLSAYVDPKVELEIRFRIVGDHFGSIDKSGGEA